MTDNLIADPKEGRSPCLTCHVHLQGENKRSHPECDQCEKRLQYVREYCGPTTVDDLIRLQEQLEKSGGIKEAFQGKGDKKDV